MIKKKHGMAYTSIYRSWNTMKQRCLNPKAPNYSHYGGRGVKICDEWMDFANFYRDMGDRPENHTLDRIDNSGNYCKENCKWSTNEAQGANQRARKKKSTLPAGVNAKKYGRFEATISINNSRIYIGSFTTAEAAHEKYKEVYKEWHGREWSGYGR